ncbi:MAG: sialidase family protein [Planctomycetota bacterium]
MRTSPSILAFALAAYVSVGGGGVEARQGGGSPPTIQTRRPVAVGLVDQYRDHNVREVDIAVHNGTAMVTFIQTEHQPLQNGVGYSYFDGSTWTEGTVTGGLFDDPSVCYYGTVVISGTPVETFLCCYRNGGVCEVKAFNPATLAFDLDPVLVGNPDGGGILDKSWIISGRQQTTYNDLHVTWHEGPGGANLRFTTSRDGGATWSTPDVITDRLDPSTPINGRMVQSTVGDTTVPGPIYFAYMPGASGDIRIMQGTEETSSSTNSGWEFEHLRNSSGILTLDTNGSDDMADDVPGPFRVLRIPQLVADPTDPNRLYLVYHDAAAPGSDDLDVFCATLTKSGDYWSLGTPVRVNDDPVTVLPVDDKDQLLPKPAVDNEGRLHIVSYDDRNYYQPDGDSAIGIKFDAFYAVSLDGGATFTNIELGTIPKEPALQCGLTTYGIPIYSTPGEYPGIVCEGNTVWITFSGTWNGEMMDAVHPAPDRSVIYVAKVVY